MNLNHLNANPLNVNPLQQWMLYQHMLNNPNLLNSPITNGAGNLNPTNAHQVTSNVSAKELSDVIADLITYQNHQSEMPMSALLNPLPVAQGPGLQTGMLQQLMGPVISHSECVEV